MYLEKHHLKSIIKGIPCLIDINWFLHESPGLKPDWFGEIKSFSMKYSNRLLYIKHSKTSTNGKYRNWPIIL